MSNKTTGFAARPGCFVMVVLGLLLAFNAHAQWPTLFISAEQQQLIEQQRNAYLASLVAPSAQGQEELIDAGLPESFMLNAIINRNGQRLAIINGQTYPERTVRQGIHVHRIYKSSVTLTLEQTQQWGRARVGVLYNSADWPKASGSAITIK